MNEQIDIVTSNCWHLGSGVPELLSIVIPVHNRAQLLRETLESCLAQNYRPLEVVIVDDGSTDDSFKVASDFCKEHTTEDFAVVCIRQENAGQCAARNAGLRASEGSVISYLDSDDIYPPYRISKLVHALKESEADVAFGTHRVFTSKDELPDVLPGPASEEGHGSQEVSTRPLIKIEPPIQDYVLRRELAQVVGPWNEELRTNPDLEYTVRIRRHSRKMVRIEDVVYYYRQHEGSITGGSARKRVPYLLLSSQLLLNHWKESGHGDEESAALLRKRFQEVLDQSAKFGLRHEYLAALEYHALLSNGVTRSVAPALSWVARLPGGLRLIWKIRSRYARTRERLGAMRRRSLSS